MTYQVIARKWRPQTFEEVTGQEHITRTLRNGVEHERLHHAYLFSGARGVGKTTTARLLAKAVNCHKSDKPTPTPCRTTDADACASCREIAEGRSIDVQEIDAASNRGIDNVREAIINTIGIRPARDRYKVFIMDEVHMLTPESFNALLKTLEEPPPRVLFIMATTHAHKVPETILSRSQQFEFRTISTAKIAERLRLIADTEKIKVTDDALREVARAGEGSMRDAQSAFDQVISFSEGKIGTEEVETALGIAGAEMLTRVMRAVADGKPSEVLAVVADLSARGHDLRNFCRDLLAHLRDMLLVKVAGDGGAPSADAGRTDAKELAKEARDFSESDIIRFFHSLTATETLLRESAHPRYQLEMGLVKLVEMRRLAPLGQILERLGALEEALRTGRAPAVGAGQQTPPAPSTPPAGTPPRRGSAASGSGPSSFAAQSFNAPTARDERATKTDEPNKSATRTHAPASHSGAATPPTADASSTATLSSVAPAANLKLVPNPQASSGGAASFAGDAASRAGDAPFALADGGGMPSNFFDAPRAGEDSVGQPFALAPSPAPSSSGAGVAPAPDTARARHESDEELRIKRGLEERGKPLLAAALHGAKRIVIKGDDVRVEFAPEGKHLRDTLMKPENMRLLREVCCEALGREVGVAVAIKTPGESEDEARAPEDEARAEQQRMRVQAESNPVVQQMLKTFRAEIVEVRPKDIAPQ